MSRWFGLKFNVRMPHNGFVFGVSIDFYDWEEDTPWTSIVFRILFLTIIYDYGEGDKEKEIYNKQYEK